MTLLSRSGLSRLSIWTSFFFVALVTMGVSLRVSVVITVVLLMQMVPGVVLMRGLLPAMSIGFVSSVGAVVGVLTSTFAHIVVLAVFGASIGVVIPFVFCVIALITSPALRRRQGSGHDVGMVSSAEFFAPIMLGATYLARDIRWFIPVGIVTVALLLIMRYWQKLLVVAIPLAALIAWFSWSRRSEFWWFLTDDLEVFEAISYHFLRFGSGDPLGPLGELGATYHVFTYQWSGILAQFSDAQPYVVLNRVLPVVTAMMLSALVWGFLSTSRNLSFGWRVALTALFPLFVNYSFVSPSYALGVAVLIAGMWFWTVPLRLGAMSSILLSFVFALALALIKSSNIPVVVFGLGAVAIWRWRQTRTLSGVATLNVVGAYVAVGFYGATSLLNERTTRQIDSFQMFGYAKQVLPEIGVMAERPFRVLGALLVSAGLILLPTVSGLWIWFNRRHETAHSLFALGALPFAIVMTLISGNQANGYFISSGLNPVYLILLASVASLLGVRDGKSFHRSSVIAVGVALTTAVMMRLLIQRYNGGTTDEIWLRIVEASILVPLVATLLVSWVLSSRYQLSHQFQPRVLGLLFVAAFAASASREVILIQQLDKGLELSAGDVVQALGTADERDIIQHVLRLTPETAVLATNRFCSVACRGDGWFNRDLDLLGDDFNLPGSPSGFGGNNFRFSAESRRRVLLEGPRWLLVNGYSPDDARERMSAALQFAESASPEWRDKLTEFGVTHFVLHLPSRMSSINLEQYGTVIAQNREFALIVL